MTDKQWYQSPRWTAEIADCSMPMTFDQYSNCGFSCVYCFASYQRGLGDEERRAKYQAHEAYCVNVERVKRIFNEPSCSQFATYVEARKTMQWGGMSDPFCTLEKKHGVGLELLRFFAEIDYPLCFSTKGVWWLDDPRYTELFKGRKNWNVKVSIITLDREKARRVEVGVPPPEKRLEAIEKIAKLDCGGATLRLRPFMFGISNPSHTELIRLAGERGATALSTEFFCLERRSPTLARHFPMLKEVSGFDYLELYKKYSRGAGYLRLNRNIKRQFVDEMEKAARAAGLRFYVSDAHFKERCDNGSCCGLGEEWNYSRGQFCEALVRCKRNGRIAFSELEPEMVAAGLDKVRWKTATAFNTGSVQRRAKHYNHTMLTYLRWFWNNPKAGQSPYTMFGGIMKPVEVDEQGNVVYEYDASRE